jgi:hypothetical protein
MLDQFVTVQHMRINTNRIRFTSQQASLMDHGHWPLLHRMGKNQKTISGNELWVKIGLSLADNGFVVTCS